MMLIKRRGCQEVRVIHPSFITKFNNHIYHPSEAFRHNLGKIEEMRNIMFIIGGIVAGILGLTSINQLHVIIIVIIISL